MSLGAAILLATLSLTLAGGNPPPETAGKGKVIDNGDPGFSQVGFTSSPDKESFAGDVAVCDGAGKTESYVRYQPGLTGHWDVYLYWRNYPDKDRAVNWTVKHARGTTLQPFTQRESAGWHFHGSYPLNPESWVELRITPTTRGGHRQDAPVVADAVKFVPTPRRVVERVAKDTITPITLNWGDELRFKLRDGRIRGLKLIRTGARKGSPYRFWAELELDGVRHTIQRIIPTQESFYQPLEVAGMRIWLDAVSDTFVDDGGWMVEKDIQGSIACRPQRKARLVVNDIRDRICPERIVWWYPETQDRIDIHRCYNGEDVWMGPYEGNKAHGGLDINMKSGTPLFAPIHFDEQYLFDSLAAGDNNNRWRGVRSWPNGSRWWLQAHHLNKMLVPELQPLRQGTRYAETAGTHAGSHEHTHFVFRIFEEGEAYFVDPWIFFWQTFKDH